MDNKYTKLAKNTSIFFIANFGSKILTFLLVRFYTELLSTEEYGIIDLLITTTGLAFPIITLCITEAVLRFSIDDTDNRGKILTHGLLVTVIGNLLFVLSAPAFLQIDTFADNVEWIYLLTLSNSLYVVLAHFARGIGNAKLFALSGILHTVLQIGLNLIFLLGFSMGIKGYLLSAVLANVLTGIVVFVLGKMHEYIRRSVDKRYLKEMLIYAIPLIPNSVFWWVMQSADRYIITYMLSTADNGLYAVANKIPTLISTISSIFFQAWQLSSVEEANSDQKSTFYTKVFDGLSTVLILSTSFLMVVIQPVYRILTEASYYAGWTCTPFLLCAMVFSCYSSFLGTNYVAMKKTKGVFVTTVIGAFANVGLNFVLTPAMGLEGTALATLIAFVLTWIARIFGTRLFVQIEYPFVSFWLPTVLMLGQATLLSFGIHSAPIQVGIFGLILLLNAKKILAFVQYGYRFIRKRKGGA